MTNIRNPRNLTDNRAEEVIYVMKLLSTLALLFTVGATFGPAYASEPKSLGTFRLHDSDSARVFAQALGTSAQKVRMRLVEDGTLTLTGAAEPRRGHFERRGTRLTLTWSTAAEAVDAELKADRIEMGGLVFEREAPTDLVGTWTTWSNGREDRKTRMTFDRDGKFSFSCVGAKSSGTYRVENDNLVLFWSKIDDEDIEAGTVTKTIPLLGEGKFFMIDRYRYERASEPSRDNQNGSTEARVTKGAP